MVKVWGYQKCSTCRQAMKTLEEAGQEYQFIDVTTEPPTASELKKLIEQANLPINKFFNVSGQAYREMNLKDKIADLSDVEKLAMLAKNGRLIKRPIISNGKITTVGSICKAWPS